MKVWQEATINTHLVTFVSIPSLFKVKTQVAATKGLRTCIVCDKKLFLN